MAGDNVDKNKYKTHRYEMQPIADEYIHAFMESVKVFGLQRISDYKRFEVLDNFKEYVALNQGLCSGEIKQGVNEIELAIDVYNVLNEKEVMD